MGFKVEGVTEASLTSDCLLHACCSIHGGALSEGVRKLRELQLQVRGRRGGRGGMGEGRLLLLTATASNGGRHERTGLQKGGVGGVCRGF